MSTKLTSEERDALTDIAIKFLKGKMRDRHGRTIEDIKNLTEQEMEDDHEWIQWAFPIHTPSPHNPYAGQLFYGAENYFKRNSDLFRQQQVLTKKYCASIGLGWGQEDDPDKFFKVIDHPHNHHIKRISRLLKHLTLTGKSYEAKWIYTLLLQMISYNPNIITGYTVALWSAIAYGEETYINFYNKD